MYGDVSKAALWMEKRVNPKFCVNPIWGANRAKFICGGSRLVRLPPYQKHNARWVGCQVRRSRSFYPWRPATTVLLGHALGKVDGHLGVDQAPIMPPSGPLFRNVHHGQVQHFQQAVIGGKDRLGLGHLAQLAIKPLNGIGGVDQPAHLLGIFEIGAEIGPIVPSGLGDFRVFLVPALPKGVQGG